jgi:hypothetical protein
MHTYTYIHTYVHTQVIVQHFSGSRNHSDVNSSQASSSGMLSPGGSDTHYSSMDIPLSITRGGPDDSSQPQTENQTQTQAYNTPKSDQNSPMNFHRAHMDDAPSVGRKLQFADGVSSGSEVCFVFYACVHAYVHTCICTCMYIHGVMHMIIFRTRLNQRCIHTYTHVYTYIYAYNRVMRMTIIQIRLNQRRIHTYTHCIHTYMHTTGSCA